MNVKELRDKTPVELEEQLKKLKEELFNLRFQHAINQPDQKCSRQKGYRKSQDSSPRDRTERRRFVRKGRHAVMSERNLRKTRVGMVVSDKMDKTVVVAIRDNVKHPLYKKIIKNTVKFKAHDENNECRVGDRVLVMETRPLSKDKRWRVVEIVEKAK